MAAPVLRDPHFRRAVVLVLDDDNDGTLGVILNRPLETRVDVVLPDWDGTVSSPDALFGGGPVAPDSAIAVGLLNGGPDSESPLGFRPMHGRIGLVDLDTPVEVVAAALAGMRVFAGYAGWSAGQLDDEIDEGAWFLVDAWDEDLTTAVPSRLWTSVLRRQPGELRLLSTYPDDPTHN